MDEKGTVLMSKKENLCNQFNGTMAMNYSFKDYRVFSNYAEIRKERENPWRRSRGVIEVDIRKTRRVVTKEGKINTQRTAKKQLSLVIKDLFISSIQLSWAWTFFNLFASYFISWLIFAMIWYIIGLIHGDFDPPDEMSDDHVVCVGNVVDFTSAFLFSVETQHTIGYGGRATTTECPVAIVVMCVQSVIGIFIEACMTGIVFAKFTKPAHRGKTILFSENALVTMRNGAFYLLCRVGDLRPSHLLESHISGYMMRRSTTQEGEEIPYHLFAIGFGTDLDGTQDFFQMYWPMVLSHRIDESSPLWAMSPESLKTENFEIILTLEGIVPETGNGIQVRTSYVPSEILWGFKFEHSCVSYNNQLKTYEVSFENLNSIVMDSTPCISPKSFFEKQRRLEEGKTDSLCNTPSGSPSLQKTIFAKPKHKNRVNKLTDSPKLIK